MAISKYRKKRFDQFIIAYKLYTILGNYAFQLCNHHTYYSLRIFSPYDKIIKSSHLYPLRNQSTFPIPNIQSSKAP